MFGNVLANFAGERISPIEIYFRREFMSCRRSKISIVFNLHK